MTTITIKTETWRAAVGAARAYQRLAAELGAEWRAHTAALPATQRDEWRRMGAEVEAALLEATACAVQRFVTLAERAGHDKDALARHLEAAMLAVRAGIVQPAQAGDF